MAWGFTRSGPVRHTEQTVTEPPNQDPPSQDPPSEDTCDTPCFHPEAVEQARRSVPDDACVEVASALLKAVADPTRLRMLSALTASELCVHDLAVVANISESAASHQLRLLRAHRLVTTRREGRSVYYRLVDRHVTLLLENALEHARE